jgi:bacteriophage N4 adsorption protein B
VGHGLLLADFLPLFERASHELALFAIAGFLIGGLGDLALDWIWILRALWRRSTVYRRHAPVSVATLAPADRPGRIAIFVAAWDEGAVIGAMLAQARTALGERDWRLYVGTYPNDPATRAAVEAVADSRVRLVVNCRPGPTTKADCLNTLWRTLLADEAMEGVRAKAIVLHDAEDVMHSGEFAIYDRLIERFSLVQLPVLPLPDRGSRWVSGHYMDEFAESHGKALVVREALGAALPSAGVGCAFDRDMLGRIAQANAGLPFDADSLTEDYELGLRIAQLGGRSAFVRIPMAPGGSPVAIRAHFPATLEAAVRQKARWITGIALSGWDRLGWRGGWAETWMRLHDRRAPLAALVLLAAYAAMILAFVPSVVSAVTGQPRAPADALFEAGALACFALMLWRLAMRFAFVTATYGWREGCRSLPRAALANIIAMIAARRALSLYLRMRRDGVVRWDKTVHSFPVIVPAE